MKLLCDATHEGLHMALCAEVHITKESLCKLKEKFALCQDGSLVSLTLRTDGVKIYTNDHLDLTRAKYDHDLEMNRHKLLIVTEVMVVVAHNTVQWLISMQNSRREGFIYQTADYYTDMLLERLSVPEPMPQ